MNCPLFLNPIIFYNVPVNGHELIYIDRDLRELRENPAGICLSIDSITIFDGSLARRFQKLYVFWLSCLWIRLLSQSRHWIVCVSHQSGCFSCRSRWLLKLPANLAFAFSLCSAAAFWYQLIALSRSVKQIFAKGLLSRTLRRRCIAQRCCSALRPCEAKTELVRNPVECPRRESTLGRGQAVRAHSPDRRIFESISRPDRRVPIQGTPSPCRI